MKNNSIPINGRLCLTVEEAAEYSLMGEQRLRKLIEENFLWDKVAEETVAEYRRIIGK
jgi:hypothetical protein